MFRSLALSLALFGVSCASHGPAVAPETSLAAPAFPPGWVPADVVGVTDGDTLTAVVGGRQIKVRLHGIDAPERRQAFGNVAKQALSGLVFGQRVSLAAQDRDRYGRTVANVFGGGRWVNLEMVRAGLAWHYAAYSKDPRLIDAEDEARVARRGLWVDPAPVPPWEWRRH